MPTLRRSNAAAQFVRALRDRGRITYAADYAEKLVDIGRRSHNRAVLFAEVKPPTPRYTLVWYRKVEYDCYTNWYTNTFHSLDEADKRIAALERAGLTWQWCMIARRKNRWDSGETR